MLTKPNSAQGGSPPADEDRALGGGQHPLDVVEARLRDDVHDRTALPIEFASAAATPHDPPAKVEPCTPPSPRDLPSTRELPHAAAPAPLLNPQRQRELIKQASGMSTRELAGVIATVAPDVARPRDTLRAVGNGRYTLKVNIDDECERGLRMLKDLLSHLDPRMSWGDLVVREAVERHDPRRGGRSRRARVGRDKASSQRKQPAERCGGPSARQKPIAGGVTPAPQAKTVAHRCRDQSVVTALTSGPCRRQATRAHPASAEGVAAAPRASVSRTPVPQSGRATLPSSVSARAEDAATAASSTTASTDSVRTASPGNGPADRAVPSVPSVAPAPEKKFAASRPQHAPMPAPHVDRPSPQAASGSAVARASAGADLATDATRGARRPSHVARRRAIPAAGRRFVW